MMRISRVARLWREGDRLMDELNLIAIRLREAAASRTLDLDKQRALRQNIQRINRTDHPLTKAFSRSLSDLARRVKTCCC